jgi:mannose-6-phosphate isomerase-like protein (cupin superfamily)
MNSRKQFIELGAAGFLSCLFFPLPAFSNETSDFEGLVVAEEEGETLLLRNGTTILRIKIAKTQGSPSICFLSESILPAEAIPVHKHLNEDELIFIHKGSGSFTLGEKQYPVSEGAVAVVPKGVWHGLQNTGNENIEMRFAYTPSGFEGFFREVGTPPGQPFVKKTAEEKRIIAQKWGIVYKL